MRSILRRDTKMMMATGERRGAIARRSETGIALLAINPLIATMRTTTVDQIVRRDGLVYRIGGIRERVSRINYLNLINYRLQCS